MTTQQPVRPTWSSTNRYYRMLGDSPFWIIHALAIYGVVHFGLHPGPVALCLTLYFVRMWGVTAGYHRYFSHRAYKTSRVFQFLLAFLAQTSSQKGALWWASHHRVHHKLSDLPGDVHSPIQRGFWYSHLGWLFDPETLQTRIDRIPDLAKFPELVWLDKYWVVPPIVLGAACFFAFGPEYLFVGFFLSTVLLWHNTFFINSLAHVFGKRRFATTDDSRNSFLLALSTLGEGWHNNHHHYQSSARNGFYWWEIDVTYYVLVLLSKLGLVWDLRPVPGHVLELGRQIDADKRRGVDPPPFVPQFGDAPAE